MVCVPCQDGHTLRILTTLARIAALASILVALPGLEAGAQARTLRPAVRRARRHEGTAQARSATRRAPTLRRVSWSKGHLVLSVSRPVAFRTYLLHDPDRLLVDVLGAREPQDGLASSLPIHAGDVRDARIARHPKQGFIRVVLDLAGSDHTVVWRRTGPHDPNSPAAHLERAKLALKSTATPPSRKARPTTVHPGVAVASSRRGASHEIRLEPPQTLLTRRAAYADLGEPTGPVAQPAFPWPAEDQLVNHIRIRQTGDHTVLALRSTRPLMAWIDQDLSPPRLTVRIPRSTVTCAAPLPKGLIRRVALTRKTKEWDLTVSLPAGLYVCRKNSFAHGDGLAISIRRRPLEPGRPVIVIDPGHGGVDPGTIGPGGDFEKTIALDVALKVAADLSADGFDPVLTRTMDAFVTLSDRNAFTESIGAIAFVSLHCNSSPEAGIDGIETYFREKTGKKLAEAIENSLVASTGSLDRGTSEDRLFVLKGGQVPATLVEMGFLTDPQEEKRLCDPSYQYTLARAVTRGIRHYLAARALATRPLAASPALHTTE